MKRIITALNLSLLVLYPVSWHLPVAKAGFLFFTSSEVTIRSGLRDLKHTDFWLAVLVGVFAIVLPYLKTLVLAAVHFRLIGPRCLPLVEAAAKLAMADVFLIALYIIVVKSVGVGYFASAWGLWVFTGCVLVSFLAGFETRRRLAAGSWA